MLYLAYIYTIHIAYYHTCLPLYYFIYSCNRRGKKKQRTEALGTVTGLRPALADFSPPSFSLFLNKKKLFAVVMLSAVLVWTAHIYKYKYTYIHTYINTCMHACMHACTYFMCTFHIKTHT